jgi:ADP-heptose:LPS heptosyltransferase
MQLRKLERLWRRAWIRLLTRAVARSHPRRDTSAAAPALRRVLFLRPDRIGDMVVSTGLLRAIAAETGVAIDVLASPANAPVARGESFIGVVHVLYRFKPWRWPATVARLRAARYDAVVDCMVTAPSVTTLLLMLAVGARERIGVAGRGNDDAFTITVPPRPDARHIIDHLSALAAAFGIEVATADFTPALTLSATERARAVAIWDAVAPRGDDTRRLLVNISAGVTARHWPDDRFVEVLQLVRRDHPGVQTLIIGGPEDQERGLAIGNAAGVATARTPALRDALALVGTADVVLSADTGISHAAVAFRRHSVVLHRPRSAVVWGLYGAPGAIIVSEGVTLTELPVAPVWRALDQFLAGDSQPPAADAARTRSREGAST